MSRETSPARTYRGVSQDERRAQRRSQLIGAAIQVYGERGYRQATVKAVCEAAGLTERYFYESFANSEDLLIQSYNAVTFSVFGELRKAAQAAGPDRMQRSRAMLRAYFTALRDDPRSARVFLVEIRGVSRAVDKAFDASLRAIGDELAQMSGPEGEEADPLLLAGVVGGVIHIALRWIEDGYSPDIDRVTESAMRLVMVAPRSVGA